MALAARNDLNVIGASVIADTRLIAQAGHDINLTSTTRSAASTAGAGRFERTTVDQVAGLYVTGQGAANGAATATSGGVLVASAWHNMNLVAALIANAAPSGSTTLAARQDLKLDTVQTRQSDQLVFDAKNRNSLTTSTELASQVQGAGAVRLQAGRDLVTKAADLQAGGALALTAGRDLTLSEAHNTVSLDAASEHTSKGFMSSRTVSTKDKVDESRSVGSSLGGNTVDLTAGNDMALTGAQILADQDVRASAARNLSVTAATSTRSADSHNVETKSGWFSSGLSIGYGDRTATTDQQQQGSLQSGTQERSLVGSVNGSVTLTAGTTGTADGLLTLSGSDVQAGKDITATGTSVQIDPGLDHRDSTTRTQTVTDAVSLAVGGSVVSAVQTLTASATTKNKRMQALALAAQAMAAAQAGAAVSFSLTANHSESMGWRTSDLKRADPTRLAQAT